MAASRRIRAGLPSLLGLVLACLAPAPGIASLDSARLVSTVQSGPLEMVVALEDSSFGAGQRTCVLVCVTNRGKTTIPFVPVPIYSDDSRTSVNIWRIGTHGAWFLLRRTFYSCPTVIHPYAVPPISPLEPGGSVCYTSNLGSTYATYYASTRDGAQLKSDPTRAFLNSRFAMGRYALQITYWLRGEQNGWREPLALESDTLFFDVTSPTVAENAILSRYGTRTTSRAMLLDLLFQMSSSGARRDPAALSAFARGDLAKRVIEDWSSRPGRYHVRDSVYAERKKWLLQGWPPYGTYIERINAAEQPR